MRLIYNSTWYKIACVFRYVLTQVYYGKRFYCPQLSMIGKQCGVHIFKSGKIHCQGRIMVNDYCMLYAKGNILIGSQFNLNRFSRIVAHQQIEIGHHVTIGQSVAILDHDHHYEMVEGKLVLEGYDINPVKIGNNVWIGDKSTILRGVTIGDNVIIGANTLVNKDVPSNSIIGGVPGKVLKTI